MAGKKWCNKIKTVYFTQNLRFWYNGFFGINFASNADVNTICFFACCGITPRTPDRCKNASATHSFGTLKSPFRDKITHESAPDGVVWQCHRTAEYPHSFLQSEDLPCRGVLLCILSTPLFSLQGLAHTHRISP